MHFSVEKSDPRLKCYEVKFKKTYGLFTVICNVLKNYDKFINTASQVHFKSSSTLLYCSTQYALKCTRILMYQY